MFLRIALALATLSGVARAQQPVAPAPLPPALAIVADSTLQPFERPNGTLLRPGTTIFDLSTRRDTQVVSLGIRTVQVVESSLAGTPAWLIVESRTGSAVETSDSLYLTRAELSPERWVAASGRARLGASFTHDTLFGALQSYQGRSSFTTVLGAGALVTPGMVEHVVELLPLHVGYRAAVSLVLIELGTPRSVPGELSVERDETLTLGDRTIDCWVVALRSGALEERLWVSKEMPRVVKTEQAFAGGVLTAIARPDTSGAESGAAHDAQASHAAPAAPQLLKPR